MPSPNSNINSLQSLSTICVLGIMGVLMFSILPLLLGTIQQQLHLDDTQVGLLASSYYAGYSLIALSTFLWFRLFTLQQIAWSAIGVILVGLAIAILLTYTALIAGLFIIGMACAVFFSMSIDLVSLTEKQDRNFAIKLVPEQLFPSIIVFLAPTTVIAYWGGLGLVATFAVIILIASPIIFKIPSNNRLINFDIKTTVNAGSSNYLVFVALLAFFISFIGFLGLWGFLEIIGREYQISNNELGGILAMGLIASAVTPILSGILSNRWGRIKPIIIGTLTFLLCFILLSNQITYLNYSLFIIGIIGSYFFTVPYLMSSVSAVDYQNKYSVLMTGALSLAGVFGNSIFGYIKQTYDTNSALSFSAITIVIGALICIYVNTKIEDDL